MCDHFRVKNKKIFMILYFSRFFYFFFYFLSWSIKEAKKNYKHERKNPLQKEKRWVDSEPPNVVIQSARSFSDLLDRYFFIFFLSFIYIFLFFIFWRVFYKGHVIVVMNYLLYSVVYNQLFLQWILI